MFACLYRPTAVDHDVVNTLVDMAREFSPRVEQHRDDLVMIDLSGLERLIGPPRTIGEELRRTAAARGVHVHVAIARTRSAALVLALAWPGLTVVEAGRERESLATVPIAILDECHVSHLRSQDADTLKQWGLRTLGELVALPTADLAARLGQQALAWQAIARGDDIAPLVPTRPEERFVSSLELDWPIEGLEPLSFVLTRLLEPLSARLEGRDLVAAILHLELRLMTGDVYARHLQLPSPIRDVWALRTLLLLDLDSHTPPAAIDRIMIAIDPTPGRVVQHTLFTRAQPTPEQFSTLVARLNALMGQDRVGAPETVDTHRPGAFAMKSFGADHGHDIQRRTGPSISIRVGSALNVVLAMRRCRRPVAARVVIKQGRPVRLTTDRRGLAGGSVLAAAGPWRTAGDWWVTTSGVRWDHDEWDVAITDGAVYRIFRDRETDGWFIDAVFD